MAAFDVVMPVHNGLPHLDASIASVLGQTHQDLRLVVLENGSTDGSAERLAWWAGRDPRISLHRRSERLGGAASSRAVVELTSAPIVARMDADDVAHPNRLERQLAAITGHPDVVLVATLHAYINARGRRVRGLDRWGLGPGRAPMPFAGGSVMFRRDAYERIGGYREVAGTWEDLDLCVRFAAVGRVLVIPQSLYWIRFHTASRTAGAPAEAAVRAAVARARALGPGRGRPADAPAAALFELNSMQLWSGGRPAHLRELRSAARSCAAPLRAALAAWALWASVSPATLRTALRWRSRVRDRLVAPLVPSATPRQWRPR